jgi:hypothetical protein
MQAMHVVGILADEADPMVSVMKVRLVLQLSVTLQQWHGQHLA